MLELDLTRRQLMLRIILHSFVVATLSCHSCLGDEFYLVDEAAGVRGACLLFAASSFSTEKTVEEVSEYFVWIDRAESDAKPPTVDLTHGKIRVTRNFVAAPSQNPSSSVWSSGRSSPQHCLTVPVESGLIARWVWHGEDDRSRATVETFDVRPGANHRWAHCRTIDFETRFAESEYMSGADFILRKHGTAEFVVQKNGVVFAFDQETGKLFREPAIEKLFRSLKGVTHRERATAFLADDWRSLIWWPEDFFRTEDGQRISEFSVSGQAYSRSQNFVISDVDIEAALRVVPKTQGGTLVDIVELDGVLYCVGNYMGRIKLIAIEGQKTIELPYAASLSDVEADLKSVRVDSKTNSVIAYGASAPKDVVWYCEWPLDVKLPVARRWSTHEVLELTD